MADILVIGSANVDLVVTTMIVVAPGANSTLCEDEIDPRHFVGVRFVLAQLETPLDGVMRAAQVARESGASLILDPAPARPLPQALLEQVDWLTPNESEARTLLALGDAPLDGMEVARRLQALGTRGVVVKLGASGAVVLAPGAEPVALSAYRVGAVDTTAAGDAFNGAFAVALAEGEDPVAAARFAIAASAIAVTRPGAQPAMASRDEIVEFVTRVAMQRTSKHEAAF